MATILVVDDDRTVQRLVQRAVSDASHEVTTADDSATALQIFESTPTDVALVDVMLAGESGLELLRQLRSKNAKIPIIVMTSSEDSDVAMDAMKAGAFDFIKKPLSIEEIQDLIEKAMETRRLMHSPVVFGDTESNSRSDSLIGNSPAMLDVYKEVGRVAAKDVTVLIRGESGTGKELIARAIYHHSLRHEKPFLAVNCAALSETLLESELFGHEKGAFTGATSRRIGKFEQCHGGTIFLDEVGDMSLVTQSKVLRLLQQQQFERVGGTETIQTDVRIISATNRELETMIDDGEFRLDLYHRLNAFEIHVPPLRDRFEDIPVLVNYYLDKLCSELDSQVTAISEECLEVLKQYEWPGNVRELQSVLRRAILTSTGPVIVSECLPDSIVENDSPVSVTGNKEVLDFGEFLNSREECGTTNLHAEAMEWMELRLLTRVLKTTDGNQSRAAEMLGITRGSLRNKIRSLGIVIGQVVIAEDD